VALLQGLKVIPVIIYKDNHEPKFRESTKAMINRMILLRTTFIFEGEEIGAAAEARKHKYEEPQKFVLATEKRGILNWMLIGAQRAINNGKFIDTAEGKEALHDIRLDSNFAAGFVEECIDFDPNVRMPIPDFNAAFMSWWKENRGDERTVSPDQIGRSLKALSHAKIAMDLLKELWLFGFSPIFIRYDAAAGCFYFAGSGFHVENFEILERIGWLRRNE
jgi:putative DNA primase/helicase